MRASSLQLDIYDKVKTTNYNVIVEATAGSGKTTTLVEILKLFKSYEKTLFLAFNISIVKELASRTKIYRNVECMTLHSFGAKQLYGLRRGMEFKEFKSYIFVDKMIKNWNVDKKLEQIYKWNIVRLYDLYRMNYKQDINSAVELVNHYDIPLVSNELENFPLFYEEITNYNKYGENIMFDYTDMIYLPLLYDLPVKNYPNVLVDELQDLNEAQRLLVLKILGKKGRLIGVGDKNQSIYSFAGADVYSFEKFQQLPNTISLPLSISYRCSIAVVKKAQEVYDSITASETAREGESGEADNLMSIGDSDFVLCRNNAPLMYMYINLLKRGIKSYIKGSDIGEQLVKLCSKLEHLSVTEALETLGVMLDKILQELIDKKHPAPRYANKYVSFAEKIQIIEYLTEGKEDMNGIIKNLNNIYREKGEGIILMTIHKSKGLEAENVYIIRPDLLGGNPKYITQPWQVVQENNLKFVAFTRAKNKIMIVPKEIFDDESKRFNYSGRVFV